MGARVWGAQTGIPVSQTAICHYLWHIDKVKLGLPEASLFFSENLTPYNQKLAWKCRKLKHAGKMHSSWSSKGVLRRTMNEHAISIEDKIESSNLDPDFVFSKREKQAVDTFVLAYLGSVFLLVFMLPVLL